MSTLKLDSLAQVAAVEEEGRWVDINHPAGGPLYLGGQTEVPFSVRIAGSYSKTARAAQKKVRAENIKRRGRADVDEIESRELSILAACTLEWKGAIDDNGAEIPFSKENVKALYAVAPFIADQVDAEGGDHARFFEKR